MPCIHSHTTNIRCRHRDNYRPDTACEHLMLLYVLRKDFSGSSRVDGKLSAAVDPTNRCIRKQPRNACREHKSQRRVRTRRYRKPCRTLTVFVEAEGGIADVACGHGEVGECFV